MATAIDANKIYLGDSLIYRKPEMKFIYAFQVTKRPDSMLDRMIDMSPQNPDFSSENITITAIIENKYFTKTFKTSEWLTSGKSGNPKFVCDLNTGQVIENTDDSDAFFTVYPFTSEPYRTIGFEDYNSKGTPTLAIVILYTF